MLVLGSVTKSASNSSAGFLQHCEISLSSWPFSRVQEDHLRAIEAALIVWGFVFDVFESTPTCWGHVFLSHALPGHNTQIGKWSDAVHHSSKLEFPDLFLSHSLANFLLLSLKPKRIQWRGKACKACTAYSFVDHRWSRSIIAFNVSKRSWLPALAWSKIDHRNSLHGQSVQCLCGLAKRAPVFA